MSSEEDDSTSNPLLWILVGILATVAFCLILKRYLDGGRCTSYQNLAGKVIIITGANAGIGLATAIELAKLDYRDGGSDEPKTIIVACRNQTRALDAIGTIQKELNVHNQTNLEFVKLDLNDLNSVKDFSDEIKQKFTHVDMLINNAGILSSEKKYTKQGYESMFGVNHLGHFLLTTSLMDLIKASHQGRIINLSSDVHRIVKGQIDFDELTQVPNFETFRRYGLSKYCNVLFTRQLDIQFQRAGVTNVKACSLHPGVVRTEIGFEFFDNRPCAKCFFYYVCLPVFCIFRWLCFKSAKQGAQTTLECALTPFENLQSGSYYRDCRVVRETLGEDWQQQAEMLWNKSEEYVKEFQ